MSVVRALVAVGRTVADLDRTAAFYRDALGFSAEGPPAPLPEPEREAMGLREGRATRLIMRLGDQRLDFLALDPPGAPYPDAPLSTDPFFQHVAIPVRDMGAAMHHLGRHAHVPISEGGAQTLPAASGGVAAYKFRDPDGHPLELIHFPHNAKAAQWRDAPGLFLGLDHSAIGVTDLDAALAFFTGTLGLALAGRGLNVGPEQARLDGLPDPEVDVVGLAPAVATPGVELLHYRRPRTVRPTPATYGPRDRATSRLHLAVRDVARAVEVVERAGCAATISDGGEVAYLRGPDGHGILLVRDAHLPPPSAREGACKAGGRGERDGAG